MFVVFDVFDFVLAASAVVTELKGHAHARLSGEVLMFFCSSSRFVSSMNHKYAPKHTLVIVKCFRKE